MPTAPRKLTPAQKANRITSDLADLLTQWNEDGVVVVKETAQITAIAKMAASSIEFAVSLLGARK